MRSIGAPIGAPAHPSMRVRRPRFWRPLRLLRADPLHRTGWRFVNEQAVNQLSRLLGNNQQPTIAGGDKPLVDLMVEHLPQRIEKAVYVEQTHRLGVDAQLDPGDRLEQFFQRAETAGQGDEGVGQLGHARLALVHRLNDFDAANRLPGDLFGRKRARG